MSGAPTADATLGTAYRWAVGTLREAGVDTPALDAAILLGEAVGRSGGEVLLARSLPLEAGQAARFRDIVGRRCRREPVSRILGVREFFGRQFAVTKEVLDPRPDTEALIEAALDLVGGFDKGPAILDLGTGSGAIAVVLACLVPTARVTALDISGAALEVARRNARSNGVLDRIRLMRADLRAVPLSCACFDLVVANPPYIGEAEFFSLPPEVRLGDPRTALVAGPRGTELYRPLAAEAARLLRPGGHIAVEIGAGQAGEVGRMLEGFFDDVHVRPDLGGRPRVVTGRARA